jgi:hypothetical protein
MRLETTIEMEGPFFEGSAGRKFQEAAQGAVRELVQLGEGRLLEQLRPRPAGVFLSYQEAGPRTGHYRRNIHASTDNLKGLITDGGVVYGPWLEGISSRNGQPPRFPGYSTFRRVNDWLNKRSEPVFKAYVTRWVRRMNA